MILLDTGFLFALKLEDDENHKPASLIFKNLNWKQYGAIITNSLVVNETMTLANIKTNNDAATHQIMWDLFWGKELFFKIWEVPLSDYKEIANIMHKYSDQKKNRILSFVDASLIFYAQQFQIQHIISFDQHFDGIINRISRIE